MTRSDAISAVEARLQSLSSEQLSALAEVIDSWSEPTGYSRLPDEERVLLDEALDSLDRGEGVDLETVVAKLDAKLIAAGA
jgi:hypothetical protein